MNGRETTERSHFCSLFPIPICCGAAKRGGSELSDRADFAAPQFPPGHGRASPAAVQHRPRGSARFRRDEGPRRRAGRSGGGWRRGEAARARATAPAGPHVPPRPGPAPGRSPPRTRSAARPRSGPRAAAAGPAPAPPSHPPRPPRRRPRPAPTAPCRSPAPRHRCRRLGPAPPPGTTWPRAASAGRDHAGAGGEGASGAESRTTAGGARNPGRASGCSPPPARGSRASPSDRQAARGPQRILHSAEQHTGAGSNHQTSPIPVILCFPHRTWGWLLPAKLALQQKRPGGHPPLLPAGSCRYYRRANTAVRPQRETQEHLNALLP